MNLLMEHEEVQNSKKFLNSLSSRDLMTTFLHEQMLLMLCWVLIGGSDEIVSNAPKCAPQH